MVREGRVFISSGSKPDFGSTYSVQVLEVGAQVTSTSSGTTLTVRAGHGFAAGDKVMRGTDVTTFSATNVVDSVTSTTIVMHSAYTVAAGDLLVNLAVDSSTEATPAYDGAGLTVYTTMDYTATANFNTVATDANGRYRYYHKGIARWELVRTGTSLISLYTDTESPSSVAAAVSASTTHTQVGATALTADINNVSVCANVDDAVKLPTAVAGMTVVVMNNGAQALRIWPASGDNLGTGVDMVRGALAAGSNVRFTSYDATNWEEI